MCPSPPSPPSPPSSLAPLLPSLVSFFSPSFPPFFSPSLLPSSLPCSLPRDHWRVSPFPSIVVLFLFFPSFSSRPRPPPLPLYEYLSFSTTFSLFSWLLTFPYRPTIPPHSYPSSHSAPLSLSLSPFPPLSCRNPFLVNFLMNTDARFQPSPGGGRWAAAVRFVGGEGGPAVGVLLWQ